MKLLAYLGLSCVLFLTSACMVFEAMREAEAEESLSIAADSELLLITDYHVNEARFNPSVENPAALTIMSSLSFENASGDRLAVRFPRLRLEIDGVVWTDLASTDFQIGRLQANSSQTIELQSLLLMGQVTEEQQPIIEKIKNGEAVNLSILGTILIFPNDVETTVNIEIHLDNVVLSGAWLSAE
jgi:hypothetical protein